MNKTYIERFCSILPGVESSIREAHIDPHVFDFDHLVPQMLSCQSPLMHMMAKQATSDLDLDDLSIPLATREATSTLLNGILQISRFNAWGNRIFNCRDNLVESLLATDLKKMKADFVRLPYPTVYLAFSPKYIKVFHKLSGEHWVDGVFVSEEADEKYIYHRYMACAAPKTNSLDPEDLGDDCVFYFTIKLERNKPIEEAVSWNGVYVDYGKEIEDTYTKQMLAISGLISNIILYISSSGIRNTLTTVRTMIPECTAKKDKKIRNYMRHYGHLSKLPYYDVGKEIEVSMHQYEKSSGTIDESFHYRYRFLVRGHWRHLASDKITWVRPFYKGPEAAQVVNKNFKVQL
jgi:hypothetical protein